MTGCRYGGGGAWWRVAPLIMALACGGGSTAQLAPGVAGMPSAASQHAIADTLTALIASAYDFSNRADVVGRIMRLYPDSGPVISASAGQIVSSRDSLAAGIRRFWETTGSNMQNPRWEWGNVYVDVLAPDAAVMTATYRIPHYTPRGAPHVVAGAWTALWVRQHDRWVIIQEHLSDVPAPMPASGVAP